MKTIGLVVLIALAIIGAGTVASWIDWNDEPPAPLACNDDMTHDVAVAIGCEGPTVQEQLLGKGR